MISCSYDSSEENYFDLLYKRKNCLHRIYRVMLYYIIIIYSFLQLICILPYILYYTFAIPIASTGYLPHFARSPLLYSRLGRNSHCYLPVTVAIASFSFAHFFHAGYTVMYFHFYFSLFLLLFSFGALRWVRIVLLPKRRRKCLTSFWYYAYAVCISIYYSFSFSYLRLVACLC